MTRELTEYEKACGQTRVIEIAKNESGNASAFVVCQVCGEGWWEWDEYTTDDFGALCHHALVCRHRPRTQEQVDAIRAQGAPICKGEEEWLDNYDDKWDNGDRIDQDARRRWIEEKERENPPRLF